MTIEHAIAHSLSKPWGVADPRPWSSAGAATIRSAKSGTSAPVGSRRSFASAEAAVHEPAALHPGSSGRCVRAVDRTVERQDRGLVHPQRHARCQVALGLKRRLTPQDMRHAADDGTIADLVVWRAVASGDTVFVPAGTIHAIGAGLVIAEIQQRSDATFRLFDHGRGRELHIENAISVADAGPAGVNATPSRLTDARTLLTSNVHFTFEKIDLAPNSAWCLEAKRETWLLVVSGNARTESFDVSMAMPFSRNPIESIFEPVRTGCQVSWRTRAAWFRNCCSP